MFAAAKRGDLTEVRSLLKQGVNANEALLDTNETPIFGAVLNNHSEITLLFLKNGADPNIPAQIRHKKTTPLHIAAKDGFYYIATLLIAYGADVNIKDGFLNTPLHMSIQEGHDHIAHLLLINKANPISFNSLYQMPLHKAAEVKTENPNGLLMLLQIGIDVNVPSKQNKNTALIYATKKGLLAVVRILLEHGADKSMMNGDGQTALDIAIENNHEEIIALLQ